MDKKAAFLWFWRCLSYYQNAVSGKTSKRFLFQGWTPASQLPRPGREDGDDLKGEAVLLARLCGMNMEDFRKLDVEDYQQVQKCYLRFHLGADDAEGGHAAVRDSVPSDGMGA